MTVKLQRLDIWDPINNRLAARSVEDIAYWMFDDGSNFLGRQVFFLRRREGRFQEMAHQARRPGRRHSQEKAEQTLHIKLDGDAWERLYSFQSHPIPFRRGKRVVVRVISQSGEESTWVLTL